MTHTQTKTNCLTANQQVDFLRGQLTSAEEVNAQSHLDECAACRRQLENTAATTDAWQEAQRFLSSDALELDDDPAGDHVGRDSLQIQQVIDSLNPTEDPQSLGRLGSYEVTGVVGSGGMGVVLKAQERSLDRVVAIKVMAPHLAGSGAARKRFAREAKAAAAVIHPNVMAIHSVSNNGPLPYLVMPYVGGESLQKRLDHSGPLPVVEVLRVGSQIAAGLAAAHGQGLVHRDIKPANILLDDGVERVSLTDFGLARAVDDASMTRTGVIAGTPQFMSPEQAKGESIDHRSDLFSLGSVLYAMCTGHAPFRAETSYGVLRRITDDEPRSIREINSDVPQWLEAFVMKLLSKSANDRFESAQQVANLLKECLAHVQQPTAVALPAAVGKLKAYAAPSTSSRKSDTGSSRPQSRHRKLIALAIALSLIVVAAALIVFELNKGTLRIETNSEREVAIRITQGDDVVEELTVTKAGESIRLAAGKYVIEVDGDANEFELERGQVTLSRRGDWLVKVTFRDKAPSIASAVYPEKASGNTGPIVPDSTGVVSAPTVGNVKSSLDCRTLEEMTACYNEQTRELRAELFKDDIPDLTVEQMREAMLDSAKTSRQDAGLISLAVALEESAKSGRLSDKLEFIGRMGGEGPDDRQIAPGLHYITGPRHRRLTTLPKAELMFRRNGPSSTAWGDIKIPFDGLWELESVSQSGSEFAESGVAKWTKENPAWRRIRISTNSLRLTGALHEYRFELKGDRAARNFVLDKNETLFEGLAVRQHFGEEATLSLAIDLTGKTKVKTFKTEGLPTTVLRFRLVKAPEANTSKDVSHFSSPAINNMGIGDEATDENIATKSSEHEATVDMSAHTSHLLVDVVGQFNSLQKADPVGRKQPLLTDDEVIAAVRSMFYDLGGLDISENDYLILREAIERGQFPDEWKIESNNSFQLRDGRSGQRWVVQLARRDDGSAPFTHIFRSRYVSLEATAPASKVPLPGGHTSLADWVVKVNEPEPAIYLPLPDSPVTEDEVIAAVTDVIDKDQSEEFAPQRKALQEILNTRSLPELGELTIFRPHRNPGWPPRWSNREGFASRDWTLRLEFPYTKGDKQVRTVEVIGFRPIDSPKVDHVADEEIHWGPAAEDGLQFGVALEEATLNHEEHPEFDGTMHYQPHFYLRNPRQSEMTFVQLPRIYDSYKIDARIATGEILPTKKRQASYHIYISTRNIPDQLTAESRIYKPASSFVVGNYATTFFEDSLSLEPLEPRLFSDHPAQAVNAPLGTPLRIRISISHPIVRGAEKLMSGEIRLPPLPGKSPAEDQPAATEPNQASTNDTVQLTVKTFLAAALAGEVTTAQKLAPSIPSEQIKTFAGTFEAKRININTIHVDSPASPKAAIVITKAVRLTPKQKQPDGQRNGFLVLSLESSDTWHITDIDFEDEEGLEDELARFLTEHPAAVLLPKTPTPAMLKTLEDGHDAEAELSP